MFIPRYMEEFEYIDISDLEGMTIAKAHSTGLDTDPNVIAGNCFKPGTLTDHHLAIVEDCIRGLAE